MANLPSFTRGGAHGSDSLYGPTLAKLTSLRPPSGIDPQTGLPDPDVLAAEVRLLETEAKLIVDAIRLAYQQVSGTARLFDVEAGASLRHVLANGSANRFRRSHTLYIQDLLLKDADIVYGDVPDQFREAHAAFCYSMIRGHGARFIDRHEAESAEEFVDRPGKATLNLTALVISILSKLYQKPPTRTFDEVVTPEEIRAALRLIWGNPLFNLTMIEADRLTRLLGTIAVRPFYDEALPGKIRPWLFLSHQLRVIPDSVSPWKPAAVIERVQPFRNQSTKFVWTDRWFAIVRGEGWRNIEIQGHGLGRIPHAFLRDSMSFTSFFVEGRGRVLCDPNTHINNRLTDLHEIEALQGFSVMEAINPEQETVSLGPREVIVFRTNNAEIPAGVNFKNPGAPIGELRASIEADVRNVLRDNSVPDAALGAAIQQRQLSGAAIRAAMAPIFEDLDGRGRLFSVYELDIADSALRVRREHDKTFAYDHETQRPLFSTLYEKPTVPMDTAEQVKRDDFDISHGMQAPADLMFQRFPERYKTREEALAQWKANILEMTAAGMPPNPDGTTDPNPGNPAGTPAAAALEASLLDTLEANASTINAMGNGNGVVAHAGLPPR